jgi:hypothetical protein
MFVLEEQHLQSFCAATNQRMKMIGCKRAKSHNIGRNGQVWGATQLIFWLEVVGDSWMQLRTAEM